MRDWRITDSNIKRWRWPNDEDMTKSKGNDLLEGFGGPMTKARARKARKLFNKCCPYYLNTRSSFK